LETVSESDDAFIGSDRMAGGIKWVGTRVDLIFGFRVKSTPAGIWIQYKSNLCMTLLLA
jgi:catalase (peroxidase I)